LSKIAVKGVTDKPYSNVHPDYETYIGDSLTNNSASAIKVLITGDPVSEGWSRDGVEDLPLLDIIVQDLANLKGRTNLRILGTLERKTIEPYKALLYKGRFWALINYQLDCRKGSARVELFDLGENPQQIGFDADYIMLRYIYTDGNDLDTRTRIELPTTSDYLGWSRLSRWPASPADIILDWGGDNTGSGNPSGTSAEAILINLINYQTTYPTDDVIEVECRCFWYSTPGTDPVTVEATLWKGGTVIKGTPQYQFSNPTADGTAVLDSVSKVITLNTQDGTTNGEFICKFSYNVSTKIGQFTI
jgi:hypothetical protein